VRLVVTVVEALPDADAGGVADPLREGLTVMDGLPHCDGEWVAERHAVAHAEGVDEREAVGLLEGEMLSLSCKL